jgi:hypothetical protein
MKRFVIALVSATMALGCATAFTGEAHVEGGPKGCAAKCSAWGQEFVGMIAMGEYSDACVCRVPGKQVAIAEIAGAVGGGAAGVVMQTRRQQNAN